MNQLKIILTTTLLTATISSIGQTSVNISQEEVLKKISQNNFQLRISEKYFESARADYRQSNALFLPNINAAHTAMATTNPLMAFGSKLNQERLAASDFNPAMLNDPSRINNYATRLEVQQPLVNIDGLYERQAAKAKSVAYSLQAERSKEYLELEGRKAFMQLQLAYKAVGVLKMANETAEANLKMVQQYFKQGLLQKTDLLAMEVRVNEISNQLQYAKSNVLNASDYLAFMMNVENKELVFKPTNELEDKVNVTTNNLSFSENRKDILAMSKSADAYQKMFQSSKMKFLPRLNAFGIYEMYDTKIFNIGANGYTFGAQLSWNLFDGYKSIGKMEKAKVEYQKSIEETKQYKAQSKMEWQKTNRQLNDANNKVTLADLALQQSKEAYRIRQNRFEQGLEKTTELLIAETQVLQKQLEYFQAIFEYNYTQQYLKFLTK
jgi:outer membrane protein TolC